MSSTKKRKNKLDGSNSKFKLKANRSTTNFKSKNKFKKKYNEDTSDDSDEEYDSDDLNDGKQSKKNKKNKKGGKSKGKNNKKNKLNNTKRSQSVKTLINKHKNRMLRTNRSETKKNKFFNRTIQSEKKYGNKRNKNFGIKQRSQTPSTSRYNTLKNKKNKYNKFFGTDTISNGYSNNFNKLKRASFDQTNKKYRLKSDYDERKKRNNWLNHKGKESEDDFRSFNFRTSKYTQNTSNYFKIGSRKFNFLNNLQKEKEEGFYNRITLFPNIEENYIYERKYLQGDLNNPYSVKWPSHFLQIGYNSGFYYEDYQDGVPILRLKKLNNKITLPPINSRYSQASERLVEVPPLNFHNLSRQERINYILSTEAKNDENNVFKSLEARKKLLDKFNIKNKK